jgi:cephalosporin hydroxylase
MDPAVAARVAIDEKGALQKLAELTEFLTLLANLEPHVIVEIGCDAGGTLWAWQQTGARVIGVDLPKAGFSTGRDLDTDAEIVYGDSHDTATRDALTKLLDGDPVDVLFIDADHTYAGVRTDYELYSPLVRPGGTVAFHDICVHPGRADVGVYLLWQQIHGIKTEIVTAPATWGGFGLLTLEDR